MTMATIREPERVTVTVAQGPPGPIGPMGPAGPAGDVGPAGPAGTVAAAGDGTAAAPGISFASQTNLGLYRSAANVLSMSANGAGTLHVLANVVEQRNGTTAQTARIFNTYTDTANFERAFLGFFSNRFYVQPERAGTGVQRDLVLALQTGSGRIALSSGGVDRWYMDGAFGNWLANTDNTNDIGASGANRPRSIYVGTSVRTANGTAAVPGYAFSTYPNVGFYTTGSDLCFSVGFLAWRIDGNGRLEPGTTNTYDIGWSSGTVRSIYVGTSVVTPVLYGPSNVVEMRNGTTAQRLLVHNSYTDASNYERLDVGFTSNYAYVRTAQSGTGAARPFVIGTEGIAHFYLRANGVDRWHIDGSATGGHLRTIADNAYDIGGASANRPRNIYQSGGTFQSYNPSSGIANDGTNYERGELAWASNAFWLRTQAGGTGVARSVLVTSGAMIQFRPGGLGSGWRFEPTGHLIAETDNAYDIGGGAVNRPRNVYVGSTVQVGSYVAAGVGTAFLAGEANAGNVILTKATAALVSPGADKAKIYFRDGTTAGTLKLVVRAGAAGAETTIQDNIPQS